MKFTINRTEFFKALQRVGSAAMNYNRATHYNANNVFRCIVFGVCGDVLTLEACDFAGGMYIAESVDIREKEGKEMPFAVHSYMMIQSVRSLDEQDLIVEVYGYQMSVRHSKGIFFLPLEKDIPEFVKLTKKYRSVETERSVKMESPMLRSAIKRVVSVCDTLDIRPIMSGVCVRFDKQNTDFVASDGHRLVRIRIPSEETPEQMQIVIPKMAANIFRKHLPKTGFVDLSFIEYREPDKNNPDEKLPDPFCRVSDGKATFCFFPIGGKFPNYDSVIPTTYEVSASVNRTDLIKSMNRIRMFTDDQKILAVLEWEKGTLRIKGKNEDENHEATEEIPCSYQGEAFKIGLRANYILELCRKLTETEVSFHMRDRVSAVVVAPTLQPEGEEITMLVMPILLEE